MKGKLWYSTSLRVWQRISQWKRWMFGYQRHINTDVFFAAVCVTAQVCLKPCVWELVCLPLSVYSCISEDVCFLPRAKLCFPRPCSGVSATVCFLCLSVRCRLWWKSALLYYLYSSIIISRNILNRLKALKVTKPMNRPIKENWEHNEFAITQESSRYHVKFEIKKKCQKFSQELYLLQHIYNFVF